MPMPITSANATMPLVSATAMPQPTWRESFMGRPAQAVTTQRYDQGQQNKMNWAGNYAQQQLGNGQFDFAPIEQAARTGFTTRTIPSIMERFTAMGGDTAGSGALKGALGAAGAGLEEQLAAMKQQYNLAREPLLQNLFGMGLQQKYDTSYQQRTPGWIENLLSGGLAGSMMGLGQAGGMAAGNYMFGGQNMYGGSGAGQQQQQQGGGQSPINPQNLLKFAQMIAMMA